MLSARLDGEERPEERDGVDAHLVGCAACRSFVERAAHVTRLARTELVEPIPDLVDTVLAAAPRPGRLRLGAALRLVLAGIGVGQLGLATGDVLAVADHEHGSGNVDGATLTHFVHESSAWNLALAVGFLGVAARPSRMRGVLPLVGAFVGVLVALSALDLAGGRVSGSRLLAHGLVVAGLVVLACLARTGVRPPGLTPDAPGAGPRPDEPGCHRHAA